MTKRNHKPRHSEVNVDHTEESSDKLLSKCRLSTERRRSFSMNQHPLQDDGMSEMRFI